MSDGEPFDDVDPAKRIIKANRKQRQAAWRARGRLIHVMRDRGASVPEIAAALDIPPSQLARIASRSGMVVGRPHKRGVRAWFREDLMPSLEALAARAGIDPQAMASRIMVAALRDGGAGARRIVDKADLVPHLPKPPKPETPPRGPSKRDLQRAARAEREAIRKQEARDRSAREKAAINAVLNRRDT